jgi:Tfp pilus assembly protein PilV
MALLYQSGWKTRQQGGQEEGFALVEVVVASLLLSIAVVGVAFMLSWARTFIVAQGDDRVAFYLAQAKLEDLQAVGFTIPTSPGGTCPGTTCYSEAGLTAGEDQSQTFTRTTAVACVAKDLSTPQNNPCALKLITVTVTPSMPQADTTVLQAALVCPQC